MISPVKLLRFVTVRERCHSLRSQWSRTAVTSVLYASIKHPHILTIVLVYYAMMSCVTAALRSLRITGSDFDVGGLVGCTAPALEKIAVDGLRKGYHALPMGHVLFLLQVKAAVCTYLYI
jgi:hypothetical protein